MAKEKLTLKVESLKLSEEALTQLKLSGIDQLEDFNTFSIKELKLLLAESFEEVTSVLRRYSLPRPLENMGVSGETVDRLRAQGLEDLIDVLEYDRHILYHVFEDDSILREEMNAVLKFYGKTIIEYDSTVSHIENIPKDSKSIAKKLKMMSLDKGFIYKSDILFFTDETTDLYFDIEENLRRDEIDVIDRYDILKFDNIEKKTVKDILTFDNPESFSINISQLTSKANIIDIMIDKFSVSKLEENHIDIPSDNRYYYTKNRFTDFDNLIIIIKDYMDRHGDNFNIDKLYPYLKTKFRVGAFNYKKLYNVVHNFDIYYKQIQIKPKKDIFFTSYQHSESVFLSTLLNEGFTNQQTILNISEEEGLNVSYIQFLLENYSLIESNQRIVFHPLKLELEKLNIVYDEIPIETFLPDMKDTINDLGLYHYNDIKANLNRLEVIVFIHLHLHHLREYLTIITSNFNELLFNVFEKGFNLILKRNPSYMAVFNYRIIHGFKLEKVGNILGVTRERIRQIEKKLRQFDHKKVFASILIVIEIELRETLQSSNLISVTLLKERFGVFTPLVKFVLEQYNYQSKKINQKEFLVRNGEWLKEADKLIKSNKENIHIKDILLITKAFPFKVFIEDFLTTIQSHYHLDNDILIKTGKSKREKYPHIIRKYFSEGIYIYQSKQIQKFREAYQLEYGILEKSNDRAIQGVLQDVCVLSGRGLYVHPEFQKELSTETLVLIKEYLKTIKIAISIRGLYKIFEDKLRIEGIFEKDEFHGVITRYFKNIYNINKSYVFQKPFNSFYDVIDERTRELTKFCIFDLLNDFPFTEEYTILNFISSKSNLIALQNKCFLNLNHISLGVDVQNSVKAYIDSNIENSFVSSDLLFRFFQDNHPDILNLYEINNTKTIYDFIKYYFGQKYEFKGVYIGKKGKHIPSKNEQVLELVENQNEIDIESWIKRQESLGIRIISFHSFLEEIKEDFIRVSAYRIIRKNLLEIEEEDISQIKDFILYLLNSNDVFKLNDLELFHRLPKLNYDWNVYFLVDLIERFIPEINIIKKISTYIRMDIYITLNRRFKSIDDIERYLN